MPSTYQLVARDSSSSNNNSNLTPLMFRLLIAIVVLVVLAVLLISTLVVLRCVKRSKKASAYKHEPYASDKPDTLNYKRLTLETFRKSPANAVQEHKALMDNSQPSSPGLPEIRITFPDEVDRTGRPQSGRVVVVHMGENDAVGLGPVNDALPPYQKNASERFQSLDLERIGGLKEKDVEA